VNEYRANAVFVATRHSGDRGCWVGSRRGSTLRLTGISVPLVLCAMGLLLTSAFRSFAAERSPEPAAYDPGISAAAPSEPSSQLSAPPAVATNPSFESASPSTKVSADSTAGTNSVAAADPKPSVMETLDEKHRLAVGDRVSFRIVEDEEEPRALIVTDSGEIEVPYIGRFTATEKTCKELAVALKAELEKEYYYQATVMVGLDLMARSRGRVYLVGPVRAPGPQEIPSDEVLTISKAILRAGGFLETADKKNVRVTRKKVPGPGEDMMTVNVAEILEKGKTEGDLVLQIGDLIYIPERLIRF